MRNLAHRSGVAIAILHHAGKGISEYRGSTALGAAVELGFTLGREHDDPMRTRRKLLCWKCRPAPEPDTRWIEFTGVSGHVIVTECEPFAGQASPTPAKDMLVDRIVGALSAGPLTRSDLAAALAVDSRDGTLDRALKAGLADARIVRPAYGKYGLRHRGEVAGDLAKCPGEVGARGDRWKFARGGEVALPLNALTADDDLQADLAEATILKFPDLTAHAGEPTPATDPSPSPPIGKPGDVGEQERP